MTPNRYHDNNDDDANDDNANKDNGDDDNWPACISSSRPSLAELLEHSGVLLDLEERMVFEKWKCDTWFGENCVLKIKIYS